MRLVLVQAGLPAEIPHREMGAFLALLGRSDARYVYVCKLDFSRESRDMRFIARARRQHVHLYADMPTRTAASATIF